MELRYDLHLHSCLSPCGGEEMTPYNLVNLAKLLELDIIALTDHNTAGNCRSAMLAGEAAGLVVVAGIELCTTEEIHMVCLFEGIDGAEAFSEYIRSTALPFPNDPQVFGRQLYMDDGDTVLGEEEQMLINASAVSIDELPRLLTGYGGFCYPAHIDRSSYSITASFGSIDAGMGFACAEVSPSGDLSALLRQYPDLARMRIMRSSDAHYLEQMREAQDTLKLPQNSAAALLAWLRTLVLSEDSAG